MGFFPSGMGPAFMPVIGFYKTPVLIPMSLAHSIGKPPHGVVVYGWSPLTHPGESAIFDLRVPNLPRAVLAQVLDRLVETRLYVTGAQHLHHGKLFSNIDAFLLNLGKVEKAKLGGW